MGALCVVATKADMIKWVLARDGKQFVTGYPKSFKDVLGGDTALNTVGEQWKSTRKFVVNGLRTEHLRSRVSVVEDLVLECFDSWETKQIVNVREETKSVSGSITLSLSLFICVSLNPKLCNSVSSSCSFSNLRFLNLLLLLQLAFNVIAQFLLGSRLRSGPVNDALREDFYIVCEGLLAIPIKLPGTKFSKALQVGKDSKKPASLGLGAAMNFNTLKSCFDSSVMCLIDRIGGILEKSGMVPFRT
jgi:steroid 22-alpha-hydroxylase/cytochrome P450 family 90 subfamily A polypeptide 1/brassinosteroid-6-oxidase 2